jgi:hypothetical protein
MDVLICCDEKDHSVGHFVELCAEKTLEIFDDCDIETLMTADLTSEKINEVTGKNGDRPFICSAYSHGSTSSLLNTSIDENYISTEVNHSSFCNVFFYTWACSSFGELAPCLVDNKCAVYIGHHDEIHIPAPGDESMDIFVECAVYGLRLFYEDDLNALDAFNSMKDLYDEKFEELIEADDPVAAAYLQDHSISLDFIGNEGFTYQELVELQG